jgi:hypothetical protein
MNKEQKNIAKNLVKELYLEFDEIGEQKNTITEIGEILAKTHNILLSNSQILKIIKKEKYYDLLEQIKILGLKKIITNDNLNDKKEIDIESQIVIAKANEYKTIYDNKRNIALGIDEYILKKLPNISNFDSAEIKDLKNLSLMSNQHTNTMLKLLNVNTDKEEEKQIEYSIKFND